MDKGLSIIWRWISIFCRLSRTFSCPDSAGNQDLSGLERSENGAFQEKEELSGMMAWIVN